MLIVELNHEELLNEDVLADGFIIGVETLSSDCYQEYTLAEAFKIIKKIKQLKKTVLIDCTNLFSDFELGKAFEKLKYLDQDDDVDYFLYEDLGLMPYLKKEKRFFYSLTYNTNQYDLAIALSENSKALMSPLLTLKEATTIANDNLFFIAFGTWRIFYSRRKLLTNYFNYRMQQFTEGDYQIIEETRPDEAYHIKEESGTKIYLHDYFYVNDELKYFANIILKPFDLDYQKTKEVINLYYQKINTKKGDLDQALTLLDIKHHQGLLFEDAILIKKNKGVNA